MAGPEPPDPAPPDPARPAEPAGASGRNDLIARRFLREVVAPARAVGGHRELGSTALALQLGLPDECLGGHWCSRCQGIWYGCALEVECPCCGNRHG